MAKSLYKEGENYRLDTFGDDCMGNASGYCIRKRGEVYPVEQFPWNIYVPGSAAQAKIKAESRLAELNK